MNGFPMSAFPIYWIRVIHIIIILISISLSWWALQALRFDILLVRPRSVQGKTLQLLLSIVMGYAIAQFFTEYWKLSFSSFGGM